MNQSRLKKSLIVPYRRTPFTKLFHEFIDGTSLFSFLFYLPPIHTTKIKKSHYLDRILSLLNYSCKSKHISPFTPLSKQYETFKKQIASNSKPSSLPSTLTNSPQSALRTIIQSQDELTINDLNTNLSGSEDSDMDEAQAKNAENDQESFDGPMTGNSLLKCTENRNFNMKALLDKAYDSMKIQREESETIINHKNGTIAQLSKQMDVQRTQHQKENKALNDKIASQESNIQMLMEQIESNEQVLKENATKSKIYEKAISSQAAQLKSEQRKSHKYRKQVDALHHEIKAMNKGTDQIKNFISEITQILQIDLESTQSLSWQDIIQKISGQTSKLKEVFLSYFVTLSH